MYKQFKEFIQLKNNIYYRNYPISYKKEEIMEIINFIINKLPNYEVEFNDESIINNYTDFQILTYSHFQICKIINYCLKCFNKIKINFSNYIETDDINIDINDYKNDEIIFKNIIKNLYILSKYYLTNDEIMELFNAYRLINENIHVRMIKITKFLYQYEIKTGNNPDLCINLLNDIKKEHLTSQYYTIIKLQQIYPENKFYPIERILFNNDNDDNDDDNNDDEKKEIIKGYIEDLVKEYGPYNETNDIIKYLNLLKDKIVDKDIFNFTFKCLLNEFSNRKFIKKDYIDIFDSIKTTNLANYLNKDFSKLMYCINNYTYYDFLLTDHEILKIEEKCSREHKLYTYISLIMSNIQANLENLHQQYKYLHENLSLWKEEKIEITTEELLKINQNIKNAIDDIEDSDFKQFMNNIYEQVGFK